MDEDAGDRDLRRAAYLPRWIKLPVVPQTPTAT
jgi:hypothetical protein